MDLRNTQTLINLARSFAGESQARNRYTIYLEQARADGLEAMARTIQLIADNELAHAREFMERIIAGVPVQPGNIMIDAGYPFEVGTTTDNMFFAAAGENAESSRIYPEFAKVAQQEGFEPIAQLWNMISTVERGHDAAFTEMGNRLRDGSLYRRDRPLVWKCSNCGFERLGTEAWDTCPLCGYAQGWVELNLDARL